MGWPNGLLGLFQFESGEDKANILKPSNPSSWSYAIGGKAIGTRAKINNSGKFGKGLEMLSYSNTSNTGTTSGSDYRFGSKLSWVSGQDFTVEFWIKPTKSGITAPVICFHSGINVSNIVATNWGVGVNGGVLAAFGLNKNSTNSAGNSGVGLKTNEWQHCAIEFYQRDPKKTSSNYRSGDWQYRLWRFYLNGEMKKEYEYQLRYKNGAPAICYNQTDDASTRNVGVTLLYSKYDGNTWYNLGGGGYILDEVKVWSKAIYGGANFTPATEAYSNRGTSSKKLWCMWNGSSFGHTLYTSSSSNNLCINDGGTTLYADLVSTSDSNKGHIHVIKNGTEYVVKV